MPRFLSELVRCIRRSFSRELFWQAEHATAPNASIAQKCCTAGLIFVGFKRTWDQTVVSWFDVAEVPDHTLLPVPFRRYKHYRHPSWLITLNFFRTDNKHVPV